MKKLQTQFLFFIITGCLSFSLTGQDLSDYYTSRVQEGGDLYFFYPFKEYKNTSDKSEFEFDITFRQGNDSATINFTFYSGDPVKPDSLRFVSDSFDYRAKTGRIFQDYEKKRWENRYSVKFPFDTLEKIFTVENVPEIHIIAGQKTMNYSVKEKKWNNYAAALEKIFFIIRQEKE